MSGCKEVRRLDLSDYKALLGVLAIIVVALLAYGAWHTKEAPAPVNRHEPPQFCQTICQGPFCQTTCNK